MVGMDSEDSCAVTPQLPTSLRSCGDVREADFLAPRCQQLSRAPGVAGTLGV